MQVERGRDRKGERERERKILYQCGELYRHQLQGRRVFFRAHMRRVHVVVIGHGNRSLH